LNHEIHESHESFPVLKNVLYADESYQVMGACFEVYREKGAGFLEAVYQECLGLEFTASAIPFTAQPRLKLTYKGSALAQTYTPDFICFDLILIELKACADLSDEHRAQVHNYLRATGLRLGLLINFGHTPKLQSERIAL